MNYKKIEKISQLQPGDIVRPRSVSGSGNSYVVLAVNDESAIAMREMTITNPPEWECLELTHGVDPLVRLRLNTFFTALKALGWIRE